MIGRILQWIVVSIVINHAKSISSPIAPFNQYKHSIELEKNIADLWWTVDDQEREITFELHIQTTGWIALGISPAGGMKGADIGVGWVDLDGRFYFQDRYASGAALPVLDNTTVDWVALKGREASGWTAIQFKRLLDTCDTMDVPIKSGTNNLIFAYGTQDPTPAGPKGEISYHGSRRGSRSIPLRSYANPPIEQDFSGHEYFEFRLNNYVIPSDDTTYHCKIYKAPSNYSVKRHAIAHKTIIDSANKDLVHHLLMYECDPTARFNDSHLPDGLCNDIYRQLGPCASNIATGWAVGGDYMVEFPKEAGYPVGGDFPIKYYMVQMHYDNPNRHSNRRDSSGIRFYIGKNLRQHDLGYLTLGTDSSAMGIAIPPKAEQFIVDSYCPAQATMNFPQGGITVVSTFPHTHLQGRTVWTKLIRNKTAVQYIFDAEAFDFNYQYENRLPKPIKLYRGDEFATRCIYNTMNKNEITLGGERTQDEMCLHMMTYYPRMNNTYGCMMTNDLGAWKSFRNLSTSSFDYDKFRESFYNISWASESVARWQNFQNNASRTLIYGASPNLMFQTIPSLPKYTELKIHNCTNRLIHNETTSTVATTKQSNMSSQATITYSTSSGARNNSITSGTSRKPVTTANAAIRQEIFFLFNFVCVLMIIAFIQ